MEGVKTMFAPRLTRPTAGNRYYIRTTSGGYSPAIKGSPTDQDCDVLANCVGYAWGRFHEIASTSKSMFDPVNAENIFANAKEHGLTTGAEPKLGALIVWQKGATLSGSDGAGHVAVVEQINADGSIVTSESGYNASKPFWTQNREKGSGNWGQSADYRFLGFVYQPESIDVPNMTLKRGMTDDAVRWMQDKLAERGYLRSSEIDGDFGKITLGALLAFQFENKLGVDGICGPATRAALQNVSK